MPEPVAQRCFHCQKNRPYESMIPGEMLRPAIIETIKKRAPAWTSTQMICVDCLDVLRSEYVEDALKEEIGDLTQLEREVVESMKEQENLTENINRAFEKSVTFGQHVADRVASFGGSWTFIGFFALVLAVWISLNSFALLSHPFDSYPFILLNLVLSCLAAIQAPVIMMSQNRMEVRDRLRSENDYQVNLKAELEIRHLHEKLDVLLKHQWQKLLEIQQIQMDFMKELVRRTHNDKTIG
jgi:uncharacterized membrane protein